MSELLILAMLALSLAAHVWAAAELHAIRAELDAIATAEDVIANPPPPTEENQQ